MPEQRATHDQVRPRVVLSSFGRYHMYSTARVLKTKQTLAQVFTADLRKPSEDIGSCTRKFPPVLAALAYVAGRSRLAAGISSSVWGSFDRWVATQLYSNVDTAGANVFHGFSLFCLESLQRAKRLGMLRVVERAGSHILTQREELEKELGSASFRRAFGGSAYYRNTDRMIQEYHDADYILTCSEYARRSFLDHGIEPERVISIPLGANFAATEVSRHPDEPFRILCVGSDFHIKGIRYLLQAWERAQLPHAQLILRTQVPSSLESLVSKPNVTILPPMKWDRLSEEYKRATVFCLPSIDEGFGMVVLEAMAFGLPAVVSSNAGVSEVVRPGMDGMVFPARDVDALAECLTVLYHNRDRVQWMSENALARATEYTWERYGADLIQFYRSALANLGKPS